LLQRRRTAVEKTRHPKIGWFKRITAWKKPRVNTESGTAKAAEPGTAKNSEGGDGAGTDEDERG